MAVSAAQRRQAAQPGPRTSPQPAASSTGSRAPRSRPTRPPGPSSKKTLLLELKGLQEEPVEGFRVTLVDAGDLYNPEAAISGTPNTCYEGGYFQAPREPHRPPIPLTPCRSSCS